ncbi:HD-GYP domain-containing protein [Paenibacillaceae bacterium WGS1546]|uniref:HD-GYP domain-containing protein n=1 Tax=Cohnella sp. WGS1546 TaxID=3366810 RepID=UPI00372D0296
MIESAREPALSSHRIEHPSDISGKMELLRNKHEETYRHCVRVALLGEKLAAALRLGPASSTKLVRGCFIHDLGKLLIPNEILDSPVQLTEEQWAWVKRHPEFGAEMLRDNAELDADIVRLVLHHHERWDGRGYPYGLRGEEIPLFARICAVADAFDSMMSPRPYRRWKSVEEAMGELRNNAGSQFDPAIVELFIPLAGEVAAVYYANRGK